LVNVAVIVVDVVGVHVVVNDVTVNVIVLVVVVVVVVVVFGELIVSFFASPANVVAVTALRLPLTDEVDVVADGFAARDVLPLANVVPTVPHNNTVLGRVGRRMVAHPAGIVAVRTSITPHPGALRGTVSESDISSSSVLGYSSLNGCVLVRCCDNGQSQVALVCATGCCVAPTRLAFPQDIALGSIRIHCVTTRTGGIA